MKVNGVCLESKCNSRFLKIKFFISFLCFHFQLNHKKWPIFSYRLNEKSVCVIVGEIESERENVWVCLYVCLWMCVWMCGRMSVCSRSISFITDEAIFPAEKKILHFFILEKEKRERQKGIDHNGKGKDDEDFFILFFEANLFYWG